MVFLAIYLWNLFRAPYKQRNEARKLLNEKENTKTEKNKKALNSLTQIYDAGNSLLTQNINSDEEFNAWKAVVKFWEASFLTVVRDYVSQVDYTIYRLVQYQPDKKRTGSYNKEHNELRNKIAARINQIQEILQKIKM